MRFLRTLLEGDHQELGGLALRLLASPVVTSRRIHVRVSREFLDGRHIGAVIKQVADERTPEVVRRQRLELRLR